MRADPEPVLDLIVVGGGPAGIAAACTAAESGARVALVDEGTGPGGQIWRPIVGGAVYPAARRWLSRLDASGAVVHRSTSVFDIHRRFDGEFAVSAESALGAHVFVSRAAVVATGARERFLPFPGWTLPNVVGVGGAQALLKSGTSFAGRRVVIAGTGPLLLPVAASLARAGARLLVVAEQASADRVRQFAAGLWRRPATLAQAATLRAAFARTPYTTGTWVHSARGDGVVREVTLTDGRFTRMFQCDLLCVAFGLVPNLQLARLLGCDVIGGTVSVDAIQMTSIPGIFCAGEPTGIGGVERSLIEGEIAGVAATGRAVPQRSTQRRDRLRREAAVLDAAFALRPELRTLATPDTIVCRCEDVRLCAFDRSWTARQAKLYTRAGMGPCQGRVCGPALEWIMGWGTDSVRPPVQPAQLESFLTQSLDTPSTEQGAR